VKRWLIPAGLTVVALATLGVVVSRGALTTTRQQTPSGRSTAAGLTATSTTHTAAGLVEFRDDEAKFAISYPSDWRRLPSSNPEVRLIVTRNDRDSVLVRVGRLAETVTPDRVPAMKELTSRIITSGKNVQVLSGPQAINAGGLAGYFYFYTFEDATSGQRGAHSHYFLFNGNIMVTMVFQALPEEAFQELAPAFDAIASTFRLI
jgi:hypothetical protein